MTEEQARELFIEYRQSGDVALRNKLVENYLYIAEILAKKFAGRGVEYDDLYQVAAEAIIAGVERYDPSQGTLFTTFVTPTVTGMIKNYFRDYSRTVRLPRRVYSLAAKVREEVNAYFREHGVKPTVKQLSEKLSASEEQIIEALEYRAPISLDSKVKADGDGAEVPLYEVVSDGGNGFEAFEDREALNAEIEKLDPADKKLVALRFIEGKSQTEVGKILGVSQMFVSRAERRIVEKLKEALL